MTVGNSTRRRHRGAVFAGVLALIVAVAAFNLVSTLVMTVTDKRADIAILRTLGASPRSVMSIFIVQGALAGLIGTFSGVALGLLVAFNIDVIVPFIERLLSVSFLPSSVYLISRMPSDPQSGDIVPIVVISLVLSFIATLYPSWRASRSAEERSGPSPIRSRREGALRRMRSKVWRTSGILFTGRKFDTCTRSCSPGWTSDWAKGEAPSGRYSLTSTKFGTTSISRLTPNSLMVTSRRYCDTAVTASERSMPHRVIGRYERSCPTIVMSVPWSVVTIFSGTPLPLPPMTKTK